MNQAMNKTALETIRNRVLAQRGQAMWRSLEELADAPEFRDAIAREFPNSIWPTDKHDSKLNRRAFLQLVGASLVLGGVVSLPGCSDKPKNDHIVPYVA